MDQSINQCLFYLFISGTSP